MLIEQLPFFLRLPKGIKWRFSHHEKKIYLTFDDGPIPELTPWVLDLLDRYGIKATFFCVGENVSRFPQLYEDILRRGHRTGNHTFNHMKVSSVCFKDYLDNVEKAAKLIDSDLFRPPHGFLNFRLYIRLRHKYRIIQSDVVPRDYYRKLTPQQVLRKACRYVRNGSVVVFHDSLKAQPNMQWALPRFLDYCIAQGYSFDIIK